MELDPTKIIASVKQLVVPEVASNTLSDGWNAIIGDRVAAWRLKNAAKLQVMIMNELKKMGLKERYEKIPERYAFMWFEESTKQDDDEIQIIFAKLLAKASSGDKDALNEHILYVVSRMIPEDAEVFEFITRYESGDRADLIKFEWDELDLLHCLKNKFDDHKISSIERMCSIGLIDHKSSIDVDELYNLIESVKMASENSINFPSMDSAGVIKQTIFFTEAAISLAKCIFDDYPAS